MDGLLMITTALAIIVAAARIAILCLHARRRSKEIEECERTDRIVFHEKIDDFCVIVEIKKSIAAIFGLWVCPSSLIYIWFCSYAGVFAKAVSLISIIAGFYLSIKQIENRQA